MKGTNLAERADTVTVAEKRTSEGHKLVVEEGKKGDRRGKKAEGENRACKRQWG